MPCCAGQADEVPFEGFGGCRIYLGFRVEGLGFRVEGSGFTVEGSGFRVEGSGLRCGGFPKSGVHFWCVPILREPPHC